MSDIVNVIINNGVAVGVVIFFLYKDAKWNNELLKTLVTIQVTLEDMMKGFERNANHESDTTNQEV
jgi:hypothetical protein